MRFADLRRGLGQTLRLLTALPLALGGLGLTCLAGRLNGLCGLLEGVKVKRKTPPTHADLERLCGVPLTRAEAEQHFTYPAADVERFERAALALATAGFETTDIAELFGERDGDVRRWIVAGAGRLLGRADLVARVAASSAERDRAEARR